METLYNWLLYHMGNEGNYLTILNVQRQLDEQTIAGLDIMARTKDFEIVDLFIQPVSEMNPPAAEPDESAGRTPIEQHHFADENQVIAYLAEGQKAESAADSSGIRVSILEPKDDADGLTFPPE